MPSGRNRNPETLAGIVTVEIIQEAVSANGEGRGTRALAPLLGRARTRKVDHLVAACDTSETEAIR